MGYELVGLHVKGMLTGELFCLLELTLGWVISHPARYEDVKAS